MYLFLAPSFTAEYEMELPSPFGAGEDPRVFSILPTCVDLGEGQHDPWSFRTAVGPAGAVRALKLPCERGQA